MPGIYIHVPYCKQACHYCDFHFSTVRKTQPQMLEALHRELKMQSNFFSSHLPAGNRAVQTIYFGGGTPSLLKGEEVKGLLHAIRNHFEVTADPEITLEANPDDLSPVNLAALREAGINRLSIGIQGFDDEELKWMHRAHNSAQAMQSVLDAQAAGFGNITIDLIYGTPGLSDARWNKNLLKVLELKVPHLSAYALTVEPGTALAHDILKRKQASPDEARQSRHFDILMNWAEDNGFEQYEISNFARNGLYSKHNSSYWSGESYLGLGPSAHSYNGTVRQWNLKNNETYIKEIGEGRIPFESERLTAANKFNEYIMTSLRTTWGCHLDTLKERFGEETASSFLAQSAPMISQGLMFQKGGRIALTRKGKFFTDRIASDLFIT